MKTFRTFSIVAVLSIGMAFVANLNAQEAQGEEQAMQAMAQFDKKTHNFGNIVQGVPVETTFKIKNTSLVPLVIKAKANCGCTVPTYSKDPILPGETGEVVAKFNAASVGRFNKSIDVTTNTNTPNVRIYIEGTVMTKEAFEAAKQKEIAESNNIKEEKKKKED